MNTYRIVRMYLNDDSPNRTMQTNLSLEEAQAHCRDPETSSATCTSPELLAHTERYGPWFDGYEAE